MMPLVLFLFLMPLIIFRHCYHHAIVCIHDKCLIIQVWVSWHKKKQPSKLEPRHLFEKVASKNVNRRIWKLQLCWLSAHYLVSPPTPINWTANHYKCQNKINPTLARSDSQRATSEEGSFMITADACSTLSDAVLAQKGAGSRLHSICWISKKCHKRMLWSRVPLLCPWSESTNVSHTLLKSLGATCTVLMWQSYRNQQS